MLGVHIFILAPVAMVSIAAGRITEPTGIQELGSNFANRV